MGYWACQFNIAHLISSYPRINKFDSALFTKFRIFFFIGDKKENSKFCEQCGVEFIDSRIRRYQMGYIKLACPVTHVWYLKRLPSYIANLLDKPLKELEGLVYCDV